MLELQRGARGKASRAALRRGSRFACRRRRPEGGAFAAHRRGRCRRTCFRSPARPSDTSGIDPRACVARSSLSAQRRADASARRAASTHPPRRRRRPRGREQRRRSESRIPPAPRRAILCTLPGSPTESRIWSRGRPPRRSTRGRQSARSGGRATPPRSSARYRATQWWAAARSRPVEGSTCAPRQAREARGGAGCRAVLELGAFPLSPASDVLARAVRKW